MWAHEKFLFVRSVLGMTLDILTWPFVQIYQGVSAICLAIARAISHPMDQGSIAAESFSHWIQNILGWPFRMFGLLAQSGYFLSPALAVDSISLHFLAGWGLLCYSIIGVGFIIFPARFMDAAWELEVIGKLVDFVLMPFLGMVLVFAGRQGEIGWFKVQALYFVSWLCFGIGLCYLLFLPISIKDTNRILGHLEAHLNNQVKNYEKEFGNISSWVRSNYQLVALKQMASSLGYVEGLREGIGVKELRQGLQDKIIQSKGQYINQARQNIEERKKVLTKDTLKWQIGTVICAMLFFGVWWQTYWIRALAREPAVTFRE